MGLLLLAITLQEDMRQQVSFKTLPGLGCTAAL